MLSRVISMCFLPIAAFLFLSLVGCAGISTTVYELKDKTPPADGIVYYMPRQPILVTVILDKDKNKTITVTSGRAEPDFSRRFVLSYKSSLIGTNHVILSVSSSGLLETSNSIVTSGVNQIAKNIAADIGAVTALGSPAPLLAQTCQPSQSYTVAINPENNQSVPDICGFSISVARTQEYTAYDTRRLSESRVKLDGIFYRQQIPYIISVTDSETKAKSEYQALSPNESATLYYPVTRSFFANNQTNITLADGVITQVDESTDGELVGLTQLPADVLSGYFGAVGSIFGQIGTATTNKASVNTDQMNLALAQTKLKICQQIIASNSLVGKQGDDLTNAISAIKAACQ